MALYSPNSHFFVDHATLIDADPVNQAADAFGPVVGNETTQFRTTSFIRASGLTQVFAICAGQILIQPQTGDSTKVNLILKPSPSAPYSPIKIKYFIYRGINKNDLISNDMLTAIQNSIPNNQPIFIPRLWQEYVNFNLPFYNQGIIGNPPDTFRASLIGYSESLPETTLINDYFNGSANGAGDNYEIPTCFRGEFIGNFSGRIGLDVVLDYGDYKLTHQEELFKLDLAFARKPEHVFNTASAHLGGNAIKVKRYKEHILQFLDAAAFWGAHIGFGMVKLLAVQQEIQTAQSVFQNVLIKYQTKNNIYIYTQGSNSRSFDFNEPTKQIYFNGTTGKSNNTSGWPILIENLSGVSQIVNNQTHINISLDCSLSQQNRIHELDRHFAMDLMMPNYDFDMLYPRMLAPKGIIVTVGNNLSSYSIVNLASRTSATSTLTFTVDNSSSLPTGLSLSTAGILSGTPTIVSITEVLIEVVETEANNQTIGVEKFPIFINARDPKLSYDNLPIAIYDSSSCASFIFLYAKINQPYPLVNYYNELWPVNLVHETKNTNNTTENDIYWATLDRNRLVNLDQNPSFAAIVQNKVIFDANRITTTNNVVRRRLNIASIKRNSEHNPENQSYNIGSSVQGYCQRGNSSTDYYSLIYDGDPSFKIYRGTFNDGSVIHSLSLYHESNFMKKKAYFHLGITDDEFTRLVTKAADGETPAIARVLTNAFYFLEKDASFINANIQKFRLGISYENEGSISNVFPEEEQIYVYTVDGYYFFSPDFSSNQHFYEVFANAKVEFRTISSPVLNTNNTSWKYMGAFGFDWLRINDGATLDPRPSYETTILGGYERPNLHSANDGNTQFESAEEAFAALTREYFSLPAQNLNEHYFIPYLNLFSQTFSNSSNLSPAPTYVAYLKMLVTIDENPVRLEFDYDHALFTVSINRLTDSAPTPKRESQNKDVSITCLRDFSIPQQIKILAYPVGSNQRADAHLAGLIIVNKNDTQSRKTADVALIPVSTNIKGEPQSLTGQFDLSERSMLLKGMYQNLISPNLVILPALNLSNENDFKASYIDPNSQQTVKGEFIGNNNILHYGSLTSRRIHHYLKNAFLNKVDAQGNLINAIYRNFKLAFAFGVEGYSHNLPGHAEGIKYGQSVVLYKLSQISSIGSPNTQRDDQTLLHELMHLYGLFHTHKDSNTIRDAEIKYIYENALALLDTLPSSSIPTPADVFPATDNLMGYDPWAIIFWEWQRKLLKTD